jgi:hypothetical protein
LKPPVEEGAARPTVPRFDPGKVSAAKISAAVVRDSASQPANVVGLNDAVWTTKQSGQIPCDINAPAGTMGALTNTCPANHREQYAQQ